MRPTALRIAWFSDLADGRSEGLAAYCSRILLPELATKHSIELFSPSFVTEKYDLRHDHYLNAYKRHREKPFDIFFYQLEDSRSSRFVRSHMGLVPGVLWVHDLYCQDLGPEALHTSPWEHSIKQFQDPSLPFLDRSNAPHQLCPRVYRETSLAPVVLFSSQWALKEFSQMVHSRVESTVGSHVASVMPIPIAPQRVSRRETSPCLRMACASVPGVEGRAHKFLPALRQYEGEWHLTWMVSAAEQAAAHGLIHEFGVSERVTVVASRSPETWQAIISNSDAALHLHTSPFGHLGPYLQLTLSAGCPAIVSWSAQGEDFSDNAVFCVASGLHEGRQLSEIFRAITLHGADACGREGRRQIEATSDVSSLAETLSNNLLEWAPHVGYVMDKWERIMKQGRKALLNEVKELVDTNSRSLFSPFDCFVRDAASSLRWM